MLYLSIGGNSIQFGKQVFRDTEQIQRPSSFEF